MKTCVAIFGLALVAPMYGNAHPQHGGGVHQRFHITTHGPAVSSLSVSSAAIESSPVAVVGGGTPSSSAVISPSSGKSITSPHSNDTTSTSNSTSPLAASIAGLGLSPECYRPNGVPMGWLPDGVNITTIQSQVDSLHGPCTYGNYAQITSTTSMSGAALQMDTQAMPSSLKGAIYIIALQPYIPFSEVSASAVVASMNKILAEGSQTIWLRLAHEVNWYIDTNTINTDPTVKYHGTTEEYKAMWQAVAKGVDRSRVKMFWSLIPPFQPGDTVDTMDAEWFPGSEYVDIVGLDAYGEILSGEQATFELMMGAFCAKYPHIPVALGETGWLQGGTTAQKEYWLGQVSSKETLKVCPQYIGFSWFEYMKDGDYRIVMGSDGNIAKSVLAAAS